jgi:adenine-specific DNA methylase
MNMQSNLAARFRPIQYLGNKTRLLDEIAEAIASVVEPGRRVADLFSGTAVVARRLSLRNQVVAVDVQAYAESLGRAMLLSTARDLDGFDDGSFLARADEKETCLRRIFAPLIEMEEEALAALRQGNPLPLTRIIENGSPLSLASRSDGDRLPSTVRALLDEPEGPNDPTAALAFGGVYFSYCQAIRLDALLHAASTETAANRDVLVAAVLGVASEIVNTVGKQFAQPIRLLDRDGEAKPLLMERTLRDRSLDARGLFVQMLGRWRSSLPDDTLPCKVVQASMDDFLGSGEQWEAAYADPPYTIDHYSRFYHVLETLVRRDRPTLARMRKGGVPTIMRGLYREDRFQSDFCVPSKAPAAFQRLFQGVAARGAPLILSYSGHADPTAQRPRTLPIAELVALARRSFRSVEVTEPRFEGHRKLNASRSNSITERGSERLLVCRS